LYRQLFSVSKTVKTDLKRRGGVDSTLIYNGIDFLKFYKKSNYSDYKTFKIVQIGRLAHEQKGQDLLIQSIAILVQNFKMKNIRLEMIGGGESQKYLSDLIREHDLNDFITLVGLKDRSWIFENLYQYHLLIQPSYCEGFGLTFIEGVSSCLAAVAFNIGAIDEILRDMPSATLFETQNISDLTFKIKGIIDGYNNNNKEIDEKCKVSYNKAINKFSVASTAENYLNQY